MTLDVVIAGGGPNGLMLACELSLAGIRPVVLERLAVPGREPKANGLVGQVVTMMDRRGLYEPLSGGTGPPRPNTAYFMFAGMTLDLSLLEDSPIYTLPVPQHRIEEVLRARAGELGVEIRWGHEVVGFAQGPDDDAVTVEVAGPDGSYRLRAGFLVGADGAHSVTRKLAGIAFPGVSYDRTVSRAANVTVPGAWVDPETGALDVPGFGAVRPFLPLRTERGGFAYAPLPGRPPLISTVEWDQPVPDTPMSVAELRESIRRVLGTDVPVGPPDHHGDGGGDGDHHGDGGDPYVLRRLAGGNTRVAERFRDRRVFLVGDAAHVYSGGGGPGLNLGLQDAINLGWKLAAEIHGRAPEGLLDTYDAERRQAADRMVAYARTQAALLAPGGDVTALRALFAEMLGDPGVVRRLAGLTAGSDVRYDMDAGGDAHPLVGLCAPPMVFDTPGGTVRLAELTRTARPLLVDMTDDAAPTEALTLSPAGSPTESPAESPAAGAELVDIVAARPHRTGDSGTGGSGEGGGPAPGVTALLLRPDGYVAWASASPRPGAAETAALRAATRRWFGAPERARTST